MPREIIGSREQYAERPMPAVDLDDPYCRVIDKGSGVVRVGIRTKPDANRLKLYAAAMRECGDELRQGCPPPYIVYGHEPVKLHELNYEAVEATNDTPAHINLWTNCNKDDVLPYGHTLRNVAKDLEEKETPADESKNLSKPWWTTKAAKIGGTVLGIILAGQFINLDKEPNVADKQAAPVSTPDATPSVPSIQPAQTLSAKPSPSKTAPAAPDIKKEPKNKTTELTVATFNILGAGHTDKPGGKLYRDMPRSHKRMKMTLDFIDDNNLDVIGFQEMQGSQRRSFLKLSGDKYDVYPHKLRRAHFFSQNSIAWNRQELSLVDAGKTKTYYFDGKKAFMPWVLLKDKSSGEEFYFANAHDPANTRHSPRQADWREKDAHIHLNTAERFNKTGKPYVLVGDFNSATSIRRPDRYLFGNDRSRLTPCILTSTGILQKAVDAKREKSGACPSKGRSIDHIFISPDRISVDAVKHKGRKNMSDHKVKMATLTLNTD